MKVGVVEGMEWKREQSRSRRGRTRAWWVRGCSRQVTS